ncbi:MAG: hypothetical protein ABI946_11800 [Chthoniobacterales bacterium]
MKSKTILTLAITCLVAVLLRAATPAEEKAFCDKYKTAFEAGDKATLESLLYTKGAHPMALEFYKMMMTGEAGQKISNIELVDMTPEDVKKASEVQEGPGGEKMAMPIKPTKKLKITVESKDENGSGSSTSESFVAEADGKLVIPVPGPAKK